MRKILEQNKGSQEMNNALKVMVFVVLTSLKQLSSSTLNISSIAPREIISIAYLKTVL